MGPVVVGLDVSVDLLSGLVDGLPLGSPRASFLELTEPGLDERLGLGVAVAATPMGDPTSRQVLAEVPRGELTAVEFLIVVKRFCVGQAGVGTGGVLDRLSTPWLTRSSRRVAAFVLEMLRRAARISGGIW